MAKLIKQTKRFIKRSYYLMALFFFFLWKIIESGWIVALLILKGYKGENGIMVTYTPKHEDPWHLILMFNLISMTPGSLSVDWDAKHEAIEVHLLNGNDADDFKHVTRQIERLALKAFIK